MERVRPRLIAVCGVPGAGKTTLARGIGRSLHLPVVVRDDVKTGYADSRPDLDWADPAARAVHGQRTFALFHDILDVHIRAGCAVVAEAAWHWAFAGEEMAPRFAASRPTLIHLTAAPEVAADRYRRRFEAGERHRAHDDASFAEQMGAPTYDWHRYVPPAHLPCRQVVIDGSLPQGEVLSLALAALAGP